MRPHLRTMRTALIGLVSLAAVALAASVSLSSAQAATKAGSCAGFKNRVGITNTLIKIGNASDISGPVPGLYAGAQQATKAYVAYFNASRTLCGRKLSLTSYDAKTDATANNKAYTAMCTSVFAAVGSMSLFDAGGAKPTQACRLPDLRATSVSAGRNACTTCFGVEASRAGEVPSSVGGYLKSAHPGASQLAASLYLNAGPYPSGAVARQKAETQQGMRFVYTAPIDVADFNYGPYVQQMVSKGVQLVQFSGPYQQTVRLAQAMQTANFHPQVFQVDPSSLDPAFAQSGGASVEDAITAIDFYPLTASQTELNLYRKWLTQVSPRSVPTEAGLYAWSAMKLFVTEATALGAKLTRSALNAKLRTVTGWTGGGMHAPMAVGTKHVSPCVRFLSLHSGKWVSVGGTTYRCSGITKVS